MTAGKSSTARRDLAAGFSIVHSHLFLGESQPGDRVVEGAGTGEGTRGPGASELQFFTIPSHLVEELWLRCIPAAVGLDITRGPSPSDGDPAISALVQMVEAVEPRFGPEAIALIEIEPAETTPEIGPDRQVWQLPMTTRVEPPSWCALLNVDEETASLDVGVAGSPGSARVRVVLAAGEGCAWDAIRLDVYKVPSRHGRRASVKLILMPST